jgi:hypothetical protein
MQCRKACLSEYDFVEDVKDPFLWFYNENIARRLSAHGVSSGHSDKQDVLAWHDVSPSYSASDKLDFKQWLPASGYEGRRCSPDDDRSIHPHDQTNFRSQAQVIFWHVLTQLAQNDTDVVQKAMVDDETEELASTNGDLPSRYSFVVRISQSAVKRSENVLSCLHSISHEKKSPTDGTSFDGYLVMLRMLEDE